LLGGDILSDEAQVIAVRLYPCLRGLAVGSMVELAGMGREGGEVLCASRELRIEYHRRVPFLLAEGIRAADEALQDVCQIGGLVSRPSLLQRLAQRLPEVEGLIQSRAPGSASCVPSSPPPLHAVRYSCRRRNPRGIIHVCFASADGGATALSASPAGDEHESAAGEAGTSTLLHLFAV
jgi:hypothetical protein